MLSNKVQFNTKRKELNALCDEIKEFYDIDKIKSYSVYIWTKGTEENKYGENVFDIQANELVFYDGYTSNEIIADAKPIIEKIQLKLREIAEIQ